MKKRLMIILFLLLGIASALLCIKHILPTEELFVEYNEIKEVAYKSELYIKDFIKETNGEYDNKKIDTSSIGEITVDIKVSKTNKKFIITESVFETTQIIINVVDTTYPTIELTKNKVTTDINKKIDVLDYIKEVKDEIDGKLTYSKEIEKGTYTYIDQIDYSKAGEYIVTIIALDQCNNKTEKELKVIVEEKVVKQEEVEQSPTYDKNVTINKNKIIVIDPGHQAKGDSSKEANSPNTSVQKAKVTTGATGQYSKKKESQINLEIGLKLKEELEARGYTVIMTRTSQNVNMSNKERAMIGNNAKASAVIHIHCDSMDDSSVNGAHTISITKNNPAYPSLYNASYKLAKSVINAYCKETGFKNRGAKTRDDLTGLNWSQVPSIYIELGFISNKSDDLNLADASFQYKCAKGIANGIDDYYG